MAREITLDSNLITITYKNDNSETTQVDYYKWNDVTLTSVRYESSRIILRVFNSPDVNGTTLDYVKDTIIGDYPTFESFVGAISNYIELASINGGIDNAPLNYSSSVLESQAVIRDSSVVMYSAYALDDSGADSYLQIHSVNVTPVTAVTIVHKETDTITFTAAGHGLSTGDYAYFKGFTEITELSEDTQYQVTVSGDNVAITLETVLDTADVTVFGSITEIPSESAVPLESYPLKADSNIFVSFGDYGQKFENGVYICTSSTLFTKTLTANTSIYKVRYR